MAEHRHRFRGPSTVDTAYLLDLLAQGRDVSVLFNGEPVGDFEVTLVDVDGARVDLRRHGGRWEWGEFLGYRLIEDDDEDLMSVPIIEWSPIPRPVT